MPIGGRWVVGGGLHRAAWLAILACTPLLAKPNLLPKYCAQTQKGSLKTLKYRFQAAAFMPILFSGCLSQVRKTA
nr:hypothetical protein [uncultured Kingella sp.]